MVGEFFTSRGQGAKRDKKGQRTRNPQEAVPNDLCLPTPPCLLKLPEPSDECRQLGTGHPASICCVTIFSNIPSGELGLGVLRGLQRGLTVETHKTSKPHPGRAEVRPRFLKSLNTTMSTLALECGFSHPGSSPSIRGHHKGELTRGDSGWKCGLRTCPQGIPCPSVVEVAHFYVALSPPGLTGCHFRHFLVVMATMAEHWSGSQANGNGDGVSRLQGRPFSGTPAMTLSSSSK